MKEFTSLLLGLAAIYLLIAAFLFVNQRKMIYHPTPADMQVDAGRITIDSQGLRLRGWVLNPGKPRALIYFGGNAEVISARQTFFETIFSDYSVYLINYRGYGDSEGSPSEAALFADALAIYDRVSQQHVSVTAFGRSLGSGVAVYLASQRELARLILVTPFDSVTSIAQQLYPWLPVRLLLKDRFDSASLAGEIEVPVLIISAENDREIRLEHTLALKNRFTRAPLDYRVVAGAGHNDISEFPDYRALLMEFTRVRPGDS